jgi:hypothetical protein
MGRLCIHRNDWGKALLLPCLLALQLSTHSQEDKDPIVTIDTTIITEVSVPEETNRFEAVNHEDQQPLATRTIDRKKLAELKKDDDFWYINLVPEKVKRPQGQRPPQKQEDPEWLRNLLWVLVVGGFVVLIVWFLLSSGVLQFRKQAPLVAKPEEEEEYTTENLFDIDYENALKRAVAAQNYRLAIRLMYLQTLKELALGNLIQYRQERTNNEYLMQLFPTSYYKDFFRLTRNFEYAWYGQFAVSPSSFDQIQSDFAAFKHRIPS